MTTLIRKTKDSHFKIVSNENKRDSLKMWQGTKELIKTKSTKPSQRKMLNINKKRTTNNYALFKQNLIHFLIR